MARWIEPRAVPDLLRPGMTVFVQTAAAEPLALIDAISARPETAAGVHFVYPLVPGVNRTDLTAFHDDALMTGFFAPRELHGSIASGKMRLIPLLYSAAYDYVCRESRYDLALIQLAPPDDRGRCSFGVTGAFEPDVLDRAETVVAEINPAMPACAGAPQVMLDDLDYAVEVAHPILEMPNPSPNVALSALARNVASLVADGDTLELGLGTAPSAILAALGDRRDLGIHTGLMTDAAVDLIEAGVITGARKSINRGRVVTGLAIGTRRLYDFLATDAPVDFRPINYTHDPGILRQIERFTAINTVIEADLLGQANAEMIGGRQVSGIGGLADFVIGARLAPGGRSILALVSTAAGGTVSRIVPALGAGTVASVSRGDADYVVTEHGIAALRGLTADERAEAMISIAAPAFRDGLAAAWDGLLIDRRRT